MNSKQVLENLGLRVIDDKPYDFSAIQGKKCYGQLWENPEFTTLEGLTVATGKAPKAERIKPAMGGINFGDREFITVNKEFIVDVTPRYQLIQHQEILQHVIEAAPVINLRPVGSVRHENGRMTGQIVWTGAEQSVELLKDTGENIATGVKFFNSYGADRGLGMEAFGIRAICCNYNAWGEDLASVYTTHANELAAQEIEAGFAKLLDATLKLPAIINQAKDEEVRTEDVADLLWGVRFPEPYIMGGKRIKNALVPNLSAWEPKIATEGLNRWTLYNAATAVLTHGATISPQAVEIFSGKAAQILTGDYDSLVADGRERRITVEQNRIAAAARRQALKAANQPIDEDADE